MESSRFPPEAIATALQRFYDFSPQKALALATAGPEQIRSPWMVPGMDTLAGRLVQALRRRETILVFGDFDTDGVTGSATLFHTLTRYSDRVQRYNPFYQEDYGLHVGQVERFAQRGVRLIVTVDSGITSLEAVERAGHLGMEVLITDHHLPLHDPGPPHTPYVDPPDHLLSGAQLAYLVAQALHKRMGSAAEHDSWGLSLSAVGAQTDWVPVDEPETRGWVAQAHRIIHSPECPRGLQVLREVLGERYTCSEMLSLGGALNMAKRSHLVDPNAIVEALLPETPDERRREVFRFLLDERSRSHRLAAAVTSQAVEDLREEAGRPGLLIYEVQVPDQTLSEIEGPLTSRLVEVTGRPTLVLRPAGERIAFSGRARGAFSFESLLNEPEVRSLVLSMGGHHQAIGGSLHPGDRASFLEAVRHWEQRQPPFEPLPAGNPPAELLEQLDAQLACLLGRAVGPFGHHLRPRRFRTTLQVKGGWAFSGDCLIELDRSPADGEWNVVFRFDEAGCDGENVALRIEEARRPE